MELNSNQREILLNALETTQQEREKAESLLRSLTAQKDEYCRYSWEIDHFLANQRIEIIKQALIINNIDY